MKGLLLMFLSMYLLMLGYVYLAQQSFIYFPGFTRHASIPPNYELINDGLLLKGWVLNQEGRDAVLYFGGNGESVEYNLPMFKRIFPDRAVYMVAYRGYGDSEGEPSEKGIYSDALGLYDRVSAQHDSISIIGRSLGSGVATYLASNRPVHKLVLITPFASMEDLARRQFPIFPVSMLLRDRYSSVQWVEKISARTMVLYAENDRIIPEPSTRLLISAFPANQVDVKKIKGAGHNTISEFKEFKVGLREFFLKTD